MTASVQQNPLAGNFLKIKLTGVAAVTTGAVMGLANPEGVPLLIIESWIYFRTGSTGAATFDVGIGTVGGAEDHSVLDLAAAIEATVGGNAYYGPAANAAGTENAIVWAADTFLIAQSAQSTVGLDADLYVRYIKLS